MTNYNDSHYSNNYDSTGLSTYERDKQMTEIQKKIEENRRKIFEKRLALKKYIKVYDSNPHVKEIIKKYDEYYHDYKTNIKLQIRALEEIIKHLSHVLKEEEQNEDLEAEELSYKNKIQQIKKDKTAVLEEINNLKKLVTL